MPQVRGTDRITVLTFGNVLHQERVEIAAELGDLVAAEDAERRQVAIAVEARDLIESEKLGG